MEAYKVVLCKNDGQYVSCSSGKGSMVTYPHYRRAQAPKWLADQGYHLTAFDTFKHAIIFMDKIRPNPFADSSYYTYNTFGFPIYRYLVLACEAEDIIHDLPPIGYIAAGGLIVPDNNPLIDWPQGTIMAKYITVKERIAVRRTML